MIVIECEGGWEKEGTKLFKGPWRKREKEEEMTVKGAERNWEKEGKKNVKGAERWRRDRRL